MAMKKYNNGYKMCNSSELDTQTRIDLLPYVYVHQIPYKWSYFLPDHKKLMLVFKNIVIIIIFALYGWCYRTFLQSINMAACPRGFRVVGQNCTANYPSPPSHHNHQQLHSFTIIIFIFSFHRSDYDFLPGRLLISFLKLQHKRLMPSSWIYYYVVVQRTRKRTK